jgi:hypothetical protein
MLGKLSEARTKGNVSLATPLFAQLLQRRLKKKKRHTADGGTKDTNTEDPQCKRCANKGGGEQAGGRELQSTRIWERTFPHCGGRVNNQPAGGPPAEAGAGCARSIHCTGRDGRVNNHGSLHPHSIAHGGPQ